MSELEERKKMISDEVRTLVVSLNGLSSAENNQCTRIKHHLYYC